jgi:hypothetical protein
VTAYVVLTAIGLALILLASVILVAFGEPPALLLLLAFAGTAVQTPILVGLWRMRNWARVAVIGGVVLGLLTEVTTLRTGEYDVESALCGGLLGLALSGYVIYWFATHREKFLPPQEEEQPSPVLAIAGLVTGLLSLGAWLVPSLGGYVSMAAIVLGFLSRRSLRRGMAIAAIALGAAGLVLAMGSMALGVRQSTPSAAVKGQLATLERASFAESHPGAEVVQVTVEFLETGSPLPQDRSAGVTQVQCYASHITFIAADGSCEAEVRHGLLALLDGQWNYDMYDQIGLDEWGGHNCGDLPLYMAPVVCPTQSSAP